MLLQEQLVASLMNDLRFGTRIRSDSNISEAKKWALDATEKNKAIRGSLAQMIDQINSDLAIERARVDGLSQLEAGSTTGDAELIDLRVGVDGKTYSNAGTAVRTQFSEYRDVYIGATQPKNPWVKLWLDIAGDSNEELINIPQINDGAPHIDDTWSGKKINDEIKNTSIGLISMTGNSAIANGFLRDILAECDWEIGSIDEGSGERRQTSYAIRANNLITFDFIKYNIPRSKRLLVLEYDVDGNFLEPVRGGGFTGAGILNGDKTRKYRFVIRDVDEFAITYPKEFIRNSGATVWASPKPHLVCNAGNELWDMELDLESIYNEAGDTVNWPGGVKTKGYIKTTNRLIYVPDGVTVKISAYNDLNSFLREEVHTEPFVFMIRPEEKYRLSIFWTTVTEENSHYTINRDYFLMNTPVFVHQTDFGLVAMMQSLISGVQS